MSNDFDRGSVTCCSKLDQVKQVLKPLEWKMYKDRSSDIRSHISHRCMDMCQEYISRFKAPACWVTAHSLLPR